MAANKMGGFSQFLSHVTREQAAKAEEIVELDVDSLIPDPENFYALRDIDLLASMIEANNFHVETLEVRPAEEEGHYMIVAGHRRYSAWKQLLEKGATTKRTLPCIIRHFEPVTLEMPVEETDPETGKPVRKTEKKTFSQDEMARFCLVFSNFGQRKEKTLEERLSEIRILEPYARALYAVSHENRTSFRTFFARNILDLSPSVLQRKLNLDRLTDKAKEALFKDHLISESAAELLSRQTPEQQDAFIDKFRAGLVSGRLSDVRSFCEGQEEPEKNEKEESAPSEAAEQPETEEESRTATTSETEKGSSSPEEAGGAGEETEPVMAGGETEGDEETDEEDGEEDIPFGNPLESLEGKPSAPKKAPAKKAGDIVLRTIPVPDGGHVDDPQGEANQWFDHTVLDAFEEIRRNAEAEQARAYDAGEELVAAQWGMRRSVAVYRLAEIRAMLKEGVKNG